jgi:hypothetical protein
VSGAPVRVWLAGHLATVLVVGITAGIEAIIMVISYAHEVELAARNGQHPWVADLIPFAVDGMLVVATIAVYWAGQHGIRRPVPPLVTAAVGMVATIGANFVSDDRSSWLGPAVAGSVGVAAVVVGWVAAWMTETQRKLAAGEDLQRAAVCSCPRPPVSLAEALPLARAELRDRGEKHGEEVLADLFEVSRYKVTKALTVVAEPAGASLNGDGPHE